MRSDFIGMNEMRVSGRADETILENDERYVS